MPLKEILWTQRYIALCKIVLIRVLFWVKKFQRALPRSNQFLFAVWCLITIVAFCDCVQLDARLIRLWYQWRLCGQWSQVCNSTQRSIYELQAIGVSSLPGCWIVDVCHFSTFRSLFSQIFWPRKSVYLLIKASTPLYVNWLSHLSRYQNPFSVIVSLYCVGFKLFFAVSILCDGWGELVVLV